VLISFALLIDQQNRRVSVALYLSTRALQFAYMALMKRGLVPAWEHGDVLLMGVTNMQILYSYMARPSTMPVSDINGDILQPSDEKNVEKRSYFQWINNLAGFHHVWGTATAPVVKTCLTILSNGNSPPDEILDPLLEKSNAFLSQATSTSGLGWGAGFFSPVWRPSSALNRITSSDAESAVEQIVAATVDIQGPPRIRWCALAHPESLSCTWGAVRFARRCFPQTMRMYVPLNGGLMLLWRWKLLFTE
jgi:hypothetical protein